MQVNEEQNTQPTRASSPHSAPVEGQATKYVWGDDSPWTPGDAKVAIEEGDELNQPIILQEILGRPYGEVAAFVEYHPVGSDDDNAGGADVLMRLNAYDANRERIEKLEAALKFQLAALTDLCEDGINLPAMVHAKLANMRDDAEVALVESPEKEK